MQIVTTDLSRFDHRELDMAFETLKAYRNQRPEFLGEGLVLTVNTYSGQVFLSDNDYNTGLLDEGVIKPLITCSTCGKEGFLDERTEFGASVFYNKDRCTECVLTDK
jgi:hypothetical protein